MTSAALESSLWTYPWRPVPHVYLRMCIEYIIWIYITIHIYYIFVYLLCAIHIYKWTVYICIQYTKMYNICIHIYDPSVKNARFTRSYPCKHTHPTGLWVGMPRDSTVKNSLSWDDNRWTTTTTHSRHSNTQLPSGIWKFRFHLPDPTEVFLPSFRC